MKLKSLYKEIRYFFKSSYKVIFATLALLFGILCIIYPLLFDAYEVDVITVQGKFQSYHIERGVGYKGRNQINIVILLYDYDNPITIICHDTVGLTNLCMWEDTIISDADLESVGGNLTPFLQDVKSAHQLVGDMFNNQPIRDDLLCLSIKLVNDIVFYIYCYNVEIVDGASTIS